MKNLLHSAVIFTLISLAGCNSRDSNVEHQDIQEQQAQIELYLDASEKVSTVAQTEENLAVPNNIETEVYRVLIYGNSHVSGLGSAIKELIEAQAPYKSVETVYGGFGFLDTLINNENATSKLLEGQWSHVIFQGQKYSQSGTTNYSTNATEQWIAMAKSVGATPILFPEHPQYNNPEEGKRVYELHVSISNRQMSCVAPVGLVWNRVQYTLPEITLHQFDGNHAEEKGTLLTAMIFYQVITGQSADLLEFDGSDILTSQQQSIFGQVISDTMAEYPDCPYQ